MTGFGYNLLAGGGQGLRRVITLLNSYTHNAVITDTLKVVQLSDNALLATYRRVNSVIGSSIDADGDAQVISFNPSTGVVTQGSAHEFRNGNIVGLSAGAMSSSRALVGYNQADPIAGSTSTSLASAVVDVSGTVATSGGEIVWPVTGTNVRAIIPISSNQAVGIYRPTGSSGFKAVLITINSTTSLTFGTPTSDLISGIDTAPADMSGYALSSNLLIFAWKETSGSSASVKVATMTVNGDGTLTRNTVLTVASASSIEKTILKRIDATRALLTFLDGTTPKSVVISISGVAVSAGSVVNPGLQSSNQEVSSVALNASQGIIVSSDSSFSELESILATIANTTLTFPFSKLQSGSISAITDINAFLLNTSNVLVLGASGSNLKSWKLGVT